MNDARPFLHVKNAGTKASAVLVASAKSDYEPDDRSTWEDSLDADNYAYGKAHATLPSALLGKVAYSPHAVHAASQFNSGPLFSATPSLTNSGCQIRTTGLQLGTPCHEGSFDFWTGERNASIRRRTETARIRSTCSFFFWPDHGRIVRMWARTTKADSGECVSIATRRAQLKPDQPAGS
jgi:hypothetical protein